MLQILTLSCWGYYNQWLPHICDLELSTADFFDWGNFVPCWFPHTHPYCAPQQFTCTFTMLIVHHRIQNHHKISKYIFPNFTVVFFFCEVLLFWCRGIMYVFSAQSQISSYECKTANQGSSIINCVNHNPNSHPHTHTHTKKTKKNKQKNPHIHTWKWGIKKKKKKKKKKEKIY